MSPKFYGFLWAIYFMAAAILWLAGVFTLLTAVVFGFTAFGLVFIGMMCVLPGAVSHPHGSKQTQSPNQVTAKTKTRRAVVSYGSPRSV